MPGLVIAIAGFLGLMVAGRVGTMWGSLLILVVAIGIFYGTLALGSGLSAKEPSAPEQTVSAPSHASESLIEKNDLS